MENSRLFQVFSRLSPLERKHLDQWLQSPFFCRKEPPRALWGYLQNATKGGKLDQEAAFQAVFGSKKRFAAQPLRQAMSDLLAQIEHFLVYREAFQHQGDYTVRLAAAYRKRGLEKHFRQSLQAARAKWAAQPFRHSEYHDAQAAIEYELYQRLSAERRTEKLNWQSVSDQTDAAFIARKLRLVCFALSHQTVFKTEYNYGLLDAVLAHVSQSDALRALPAVGLYFYCYQFLTDPEAETHFNRFKRQFFAQLDQLPTEEQRNLHLLALNFCIRKINQLEQAYFREALDLYQLALQTGILLENGRLSPFAYNNIVAIALKVNETDWAEKFAHEQAPFLEKKLRDANYHLNLARVEYRRQNMKAALLHLQEADYKDLINNLIAKTLQLKIYFETGEFDALEAHLQNMQTFIRRQKGIGYHKTNYLNIVKYTRRLMQLPNSRKSREALRAQVAMEETLTEKEWLLEMAGA